LYTVPGQVYYNASRKLILKGVDGIVFVADSQMERMEANQESMQNLYDNMAEYGYDLTKMPFVIQYNKRDLPNAAPVPYLEYTLNRRTRRVPVFESVASVGTGVFEALNTVSRMVLASEFGPHEEAPQEAQRHA
jgi:signal recognition particle receptor subunit beta